MEKDKHLGLRIDSEYISLSGKAERKTPRREAS